MADSFVAGTDFSAVIEELLNDDRLTKWERSFCESLGAQLDEGRTLSPRQREVLEQIHVRH